ncbi:uncharacterized protein LOC110674605 [Aedes aegypti]|uniref:Uncharacterized protein n=1 Tax=Aedes aegypti TaxID=7159 RepID=A0A6I8U9C4_AEDAE|nr:uncharacterized protein LOC110674605 [Aedes aegypti]
MSNREIQMRLEKHRKSFRQFRQQFANMVEAVHSMQTTMSEMKAKHDGISILLELKFRSFRPDNAGRDSGVKSVVARSAVTRLEGDRKRQDGPKSYSKSEPHAEGMAKKPKAYDTSSEEEPPRKEIPPHVLEELERRRALKRYHAYARRVALSYLPKGPGKPPYQLF